MNNKIISNFKFNPSTINKCIEMLEVFIQLVPKAEDKDAEGILMEILHDKIRFFSNYDE